MEEEARTHSIAYKHMQEKTDAELVKLARENDTHAFDVLMERYQVMAQYVAIRMVSNGENARELVQEAMLQAFLSLSHLHDDTRFKSWFYGIVFNLCRNWRRTPKNNIISLSTSSESVLNELYSTEHALLDPQDYLEQLEVRMVLDTALDILSPKNRIVAQLFYYQELSVQEIAQKLSISQTAVKNRLHKSRVQLRAHLLATAPEMQPMIIQQRRKGIMIKVTIAKIVSQDHFRTLLILQDEAQQRVLSTWLKTDWTDPLERMRMVPQLQNALIEPLTTDFMVNLLKATHGVLRKVEIDVLQDEILYSKVYIESHGEEMCLNARLNDALPLAQRVGSDIYVADTVMEQLGQRLPVQLAEDAAKEIEKLSKTLTEKMFASVIGQTVVTREEPRNLDFSEGFHGWAFMGFPKDASTYQMDASVQRGGKGSLLIAIEEVQLVSIASLQHEGFLADRYPGKRLRMSAYIKTDDVKQVTVGVELNGAKGASHLKQILAPAIRGTTEWTRHEIVFDVASDISLIKFTLRMMGRGRVWLNTVHFEEVDTTIPLTEDTGIHLPLPDEPQNTQFAYNLAHWDLWGSHPQDYSCGVDSIVKSDGSPCGYIKANAATPRGYGVLRQMVRSKLYEGKYVRLVSTIKTTGVGIQASLYLQLDGAGTDEVREKQLHNAGEWEQQEVMMFVPEQGVAILRFGVILYGKGQVWLNAVRLETL